MAEYILLRQQTPQWAEELNTFVSSIGCEFTGSNKRVTIDLTDEQVHQVEEWTKEHGDAFVDIFRRADVLPPKAAPLAVKLGPVTPLTSALPSWLSSTNEP